MQVQKFLTMLVNDTSIAQLQLQVRVDLNSRKVVSFYKIRFERIKYNVIVVQLLRLGAFK